MAIGTKPSELNKLAYTTTEEIEVRHRFEIDYKGGQDFLLNIYEMVETNEYGEDGLKISEEQRIAAIPMTRTDLVSFKYYIEGKALAS